LGKTPRGGSAGRDLVALPHRQAGNSQATDRKTVREDISGFHLELGQGTTHRLQIGHVQSTGVDFAVRDHDD
jgi:hypothetical protein